MGTWPSLYSMRGAYAQGGAVNAATSAGVSITPGTGANVKATGYTEILTATERPCCGLWLQIQRLTFEAADYLIDIGIGAALSEVALINNLIFSANGSTDGFSRRRINTANYYFPIALPVGVRLSAKAQCGIASGSNRDVRMKATAIIGSWFDQPYGQVETIGANTADSGGVAVANALDSAATWVELSAACPRNLRGFVIGIGQQNGVNAASREMRVEIGIGAASSEVSIATFFTSTNGSNGTVQNPASPYLPIPIAAGQRIAAKINALSSSSTQGLDLVLYGLAA